MKCCNILKYRLEWVEYKKTPSKRMSVSDQVAHGDVRREAHNLSHAALAAAEREVFVEEEAQNTCQHVIGRRGHPVRAPGNIVQAEHDRRADERVDHTDKQEFPQLCIKERAQSLQSSASRSSSSVSIR